MYLVTHFGANFGYFSKKIVPHVPNILKTSIFIAIKVMAQRVHIMGAPGSGISTLGRQLGAKLGCRALDVDDYHWFTSDPEPYRRRRNPAHRLQLLEADLDANTDWVLSGSLCGWGDVLIPRFTAVVWLGLPTTLRLARIEARELARYGPERLEAGGDLATVFEKFKAWAVRYDDPDYTGVRSRQAELTWLEALNCPVWRSSHDPDFAELQEWLRLSNVSI
jgi:adenylate kinase family enzyme